MKPPLELRRKVAAILIPPGRILHALAGRPLTVRELKELVGIPPVAAGPVYRPTEVGKVIRDLLSAFEETGMVQRRKDGTSVRYHLTLLGQEQVKVYQATIPPVRVP